jgi:hypothetical protein
MKGLAIASALVLGVALLPAGPAHARGCIKGAVIGGTAGHFAGHHGLLGAAAGCLVGRHYANKHARMNQTAPRSGYGSSSGNGPAPGYNASPGYGSSPTPQTAPAQHY